MALPRTLRLKKTRDIEGVFRKSQKAESFYFSLRAHWKAAPPGRALVVVPKKVAKKSVMRNLLKRRAIEWLRTKGGVGKRNVDLVVSVKPAAVSISKKEFYSDLSSVFFRVFHR